MTGSPSSQMSGWNLKPTLTSANSPSLPSWASHWRPFCGDSALFTTLISVVCFQPLCSQPSLPSLLIFFGPLGLLGGIPDPGFALLQIILHSASKDIFPKKHIILLLKVSHLPYKGKNSVTQSIRSFMISSLHSSHFPSLFHLLPPPSSLPCTSYTELFLVPHMYDAISHVAFSSRRTQLMNFSWKPFPIPCPTRQNCPLVAACPYYILQMSSVAFLPLVCPFHVCVRLGLANYESLIETTCCSSLCPMCLTPCLAQ